MSDSLDLASTIGTWVGVGVGVVALISIIGPAVIWYASTRDRQKTLNSVGRHNNNYLSPGYHLGPNIWLGQRIRAPMLKSADSVKPFNTLPAFDANKMKSIDTESTWVQFGTLLEAYSIPFQRGDNLVIKAGRAFLGVHPWWILTIGLLGRYSNLKVPGSPSTRKVSVFRRDGRGAPQDSAQIAYPSPDMQQGVDYTTANKSVRFESPSGVGIGTLQIGDETLLYGTTGSLAFSTSMPFPGKPPLQIVKFDPTTTRESYDDSLDPRDLFLVAMGFLKTSQSRYVAIMELDEISEDMSDEDDSVPRPHPPDDLTYRHSHIEIDRHHPLSHESPSAPVGDNEYEDYGDNVDRYTPRGPRRQHVQRPFKAYRLSNVELNQDMRQIGIAFLGISRIDTFSLTPVASERVTSMMNEFALRTNVPADSDWIRLPRIARREDIYIERGAAQSLAYGLLCLQWHPQRYLLDSRTRKGIGMGLFGAAAHDLPGFVFRLREGMEWLNPSQADKRKLSSALGLVHTRLEAGSGSRVFAAAQDLDTILSELGSRGEQAYIGQIIGILAITNSEFRDLVYDSLRSLKETASSIVSLDMPSATLKVPKAFGVMQHFYVDWQEMFPEEIRNPETLNVSYTQIVLATTQSLVKCEMLRCCPDASPLIDTVMNLGDVVYMA